MDKKIVVIIQARMGSTRLPAKVMKQLWGKTILQHVVERVQRSRYKLEVVIATTVKKEDDVIVNEANKIGVKYYRGSEDDVLSRYYEAAKENEANIVIRITSDCPLIDWEVLDKMIEMFNNQADIEYLSNGIQRTFPRGLDVEIFYFETLKRAYNQATLPSEREHVTPYIWRHPELFKIGQYTNKKDYSFLRWTLDTQEDLELIRRIYDALYPVKKDFTFCDIIEQYEHHPEWKLINAHVKQKKI